MVLRFVRLALRSACRSQRSNDCGGRLRWWTEAGGCQWHRGLVDCASL